MIARLRGFHTLCSRPGFDGFRLARDGEIALIIKKIDRVYLVLCNDGLAYVYDIAISGVVTR